MANSLASNVSTKVAKVFSDSFESSRVLSKAVNTQFMTGANGISNDTGDTVYMKRATQYKAIETAGGDISASTKNDIGVGRIAATVQNYITVPVNYTNLEEVTQLDQLKEILAPAAEELCTRLELNIAEKLRINAGLAYGTPGTIADAWEDVAGMAALASAVGMPDSGERYYVMNPFTAMKLSSAQNGLNAADSLVRTAWENAQVASNFGGVRALTSNSLKSFTSGSISDRAGTLAATPDATFATHKDTMIQSLQLAGLSNSLTIVPGDILEITGRYYVNARNKQTVLGADGLPVKRRMTVVTGGTTSGSGTITVTATCAAIYGASGGLDEQYTNADAALTSGDVVTVLGAASTVYQPNLFFHKNAFALSSLTLPKLHATDTIMQSKDGLSMRVTKYSDGDKNAQRWRIDMLPVMGIINPLFIGQAYGV